VSFGLGTTLTVRFLRTGLANVCVGLSVVLVCVCVCVSVDRMVAREWCVCASAA
jgi:hypothetical protein